MKTETALGTFGHVFDAKKVNGVGLFAGFGAGEAPRAS